MDLIKMLEENDFVGLKEYAEKRTRAIVENRILDKMNAIRDSVKIKGESA